MGTRGLIGLIIAGKRHAVYNHFDSYPDGLGRDVVRFIISLTKEEIEELINLLEEITWLNDDDPVDPELVDHYMALEYHITESTRSWSQLFGGVTRGRILTEIQSGKLKHVPEFVTFHEDTLFCEWAYFIDFEKKTLECYQQKDLIDTVSFYDLKNLGERYMDRLVKITSEEYSDEE